MKIVLPFLRRSRQESPESPLLRRIQPTALRAVLILLTLAVLVGGGVVWRSRAGSATAAPGISMPVTQGDLAVTVESDGAVQADRSVDVAFQTGGQVHEVLVAAGAQVRAGQPLARLDDRDLQLDVKNAEAGLQAAQAGLDKARNGAATPQDLARAQASLAAAQAGLTQARNGTATPADIREAEAGLRSAQAQLEALRRPSQDRISAAQLTLTQARAALQQTRDDRSAAKTNAQLALDRATSGLTQAQSAYATAKGNWEYVQETGKDPANPETTDPTGKKTANKVNDTQRQQYYDQFVQAAAALRSAEAAVAQAQVEYDTARQNEATAVQEAEARVGDAQKQLDALMNPSQPAIVQAEAAVAQAQARLDKLRQGGSAADIASAQAQVDQARADQEALTAPVAAADIAIAEANVTQAQVALDRARRALEQAVLVAPFDGTVATVNVVPGSTVGSGSNAGTAAFTLVDTSTLYLDLSVSESDIARVAPGQAVDLTFDALEGQVITGTAESVATTATTDNNVVTYLVRVRFDPGDAPVKVGMTASASIIVERRKNVIQVPNRAIQSRGPARSVQVLYGEEKTPVTVLVETGATDGSRTEILKCLQTGNQCLRPGDELLVPVPQGTAGQKGSEGTGGTFSVGPGGAPQRMIIQK